MNDYPFFLITMEALVLKQKTMQNAFTRLYNTLDEAAKQEVVKISEDILNNLLTFEKVEEDDTENESISEMRMPTNLKRQVC